MEIIKKINNETNIWTLLPQLTKEELEKAIEVSAESYYNSGISLIPDNIYDILADRLRIMDPESKILFSIGAPAKGKKITLPYWMGSMNKIKTDDNLIKKWTKQYHGPYVISDKLDGVSCLLTLNKRKLNLYTRGNGTIGQNVTFLATMVNLSADKLLSLDQNVAIRGELIMSKSNFGKYEKIMANARNMVSGIVNSKPKSINEKHALDVDFVTYEIIDPIIIPSEQFKLLKKWALNVVHNDIYQNIDSNILDSILQKRKKLSAYEIDGIIVTDDIKHKPITSGNPPYSFAYKGMTPTADVRVIEVLWKPSSYGILVPRIHFEKVRLSQVYLEYTTGFNAKFIVDNVVGPDAIIRVVRSGGVIPDVIAVIKPAKTPSLPTNYDFVWDKTHTNIILKNPEDDNTVIIQRLTKFIRTIGAESISEGIVTKLVNAGYDTIPKVISLTVDDLLALEGFKETLATKLYNNLQDALQNVNVLILMVASNIFGRGFGERKIKRILNVYPNIVDQYSENKRTVWENKLMDLEGFDTITVNGFLDALPDFQKFYYVVTKIIKVAPYVKKIKEKGLFRDQHVVFTGFRSKEWQKFIEAEGGQVSASVSKTTTLLVYADGEESSSKYQKAIQLGVKTMTRTEFGKKYEV